MVSIAAIVLLSPEMLQAVALLALFQHSVEPVAEGVATYYTVASSSDLTASGEPFSDDLFTCAMPEGTFGTYHLIVAENGRAVVCRLNDRGPFVKGRVIDVSRAAMRQLAGDDGMARVKVYELGHIIPGL